MTAVAVRRRRLARAARNKGGNFTRWLIIVTVAFGALLAIGAAAGAAALYATYDHYSAGYVPIEEKLQQTNVGLTEVYDRNGIFLGQLSNPDAQLLEPIQLDQIAPWMIEATISTEDNGYYEHPGFSWRGILRAAKERYVDQNEETGTGGSSITQQLVKNVYICPSIVTSDDKVCTQAERTVQRKLKEIAYAIELEEDYTKDEILQYYMNSISYADRYIGVQAAAQGYFHKDAIDLTLEEAALLAGVPAGPSRYHPRDNCVRVGEGECFHDSEGKTIVTGDAKVRQEVVLDLMAEHGRITQEQADLAKTIELRVYPAASDIRAAAWIDNQVEPRLVRMCSAGIIPLLEGATDCVASVHSGGYKVTSTVDIVETEAAQAMMASYIAAGLSNGCNCYNAAIATIDPATGQVIVYAPNVDPKNTADIRVDGDIDQLTEVNQPGSSFKPVVYLAWFDYENKAPMSTFWDTSPLTVQGVAIENPRSGSLKSEGLISARFGLGGSQNVPSFRAAEEAGIENVIEMAKKMGITTLDQHFDPTFSNHEAVTYGASIATGGANIRAIDMAYANATFSNMGLMVGVPSYAMTIPLEDLKDFANYEGLDYDKAWQQFYEFNRGNIRIPGTRELDPVTVLRVEAKDGTVLYDHATAGDLQSKQVVDAGSVWLVHSIISDCESRKIIWGCGGSNDDLALEVFLNGVEVDTGVKTGTQQGPLSAVDTLETWMNGYSRHAATALWVGNSNNELVRDGPQANYAAANTTVRLFKNWMSAYHAYLQGLGAIGTPLGFKDLQPANVTFGSFKTPATDRGLSGGCNQTVQSWYRTDVEYASECTSVAIDTRNGLLAGPNTPAQYRGTKGVVKPPIAHPEGMSRLIAAFNIPTAPTEVSTGQMPEVRIVSPSNGSTVSGARPVVITVDVPGLEGWVLEIGQGASPGSWTQLGSGGSVRDAIVATIDGNALSPGVWTLRLSATSRSASSGLVATSTFNIQGGGGGPDGDGTETPEPGGGGGGGNGNGNGQPGQTPTPEP